MSALEQARLIRERKLSSSELVGLYLDRIARHDPALGSFVQVLEENGRAAARKMDAAPREGRPPFHGVPTGIKDLNLARGTFTRMGSKAFRYFYSPIDDVTTAAIRRAGFVILGKLSTSELGAMPVTEPAIHLPTRNPWDRAHTSGGSSGGSATAVAAGLLPIAQASDGAGSIRIPASLCGLVGHKASRYAIPNDYGRIDPAGMITIGPLGRTVDDVAAMLDVLAGRRGETSFLASAQRPRSQLTVRFTTTSPIGKATPEIAAVVIDVVKRLERMGHHVEEGAPPEGSLEEVVPIWQRQLARIPLLSDSSLQPVTRWLRETGRHIPEAEVARRAAGVSERVLRWFGDADLWVTPTLPILAPRVGQWAGLGPEEAFRAAAVMGAFTAIFNLTGQPAVSVPAGISADGLPIGVQLVGRMNADGQVLAVARQLEQDLSWVQRHARGSYP
ncbi:MAG: Amidase [Myxococcaceae bacterium]|nr:Amidase [Myxococcaceae bacterium]